MWDENKLWSKVNKTETCWIFTGALAHGHGRIVVNGRCEQAHRVSYELHHGKIPSGLMVRHLCHNKRCVNPEHLILGTHQDNMDDSVRDKKFAYGQRNGQSVLTEKSAKEIFYKDGTCKQIAMQYGVSPSTVSNIKNRKTWKYMNV